MEENKESLLKKSMHYGLLMGGYWTIKYIFLILSDQIPFMASIYSGMTFAVPFVLYYLMKNFKQETNEEVGFFKFWRLGILIFFFASLIASPIHYINYQYIVSPDFFEALKNSALEAVNILAERYPEIDTTQAENFMNYTPIQLTMIDILGNTAGGIFISLPVAALVKYIKQKTIN